MYLCTIKLAVLLTCVVMITGCAMDRPKTFAQQQQSQIDIKYAQKSIRMNELRQSLKSQFPEFTKLKKEIGISSSGPSIVQRNNDAFLNDAEKKIIVDALTNSVSIMSEMLALESSPFPEPYKTYFRNAGQRYYVDSDKMYADLVGGRISKGEAAARHYDAYLEYGKRWDDANDLLNQWLVNTHAAEVKQRQQNYVNAMNAWHQMEIINAYNRPWYTTCTSNLNYTNCTTY